MILRVMIQWVIAASLGWLLLSCGAARNSRPGPVDPAELTRYLLVIEEKPVGQVSHVWQPLSDGDAAGYLPHAYKGRFEGSITQVAFSRDCEAERDDCEETCRASLKGRNWSHASKGAKDAICRKKCMPAYLDCCRLKEASEAGTQRISFPTVDGAVEWLKRHRRDVLVGTVVVIAGVAFVAVVAGSGGAALVLAPAVLLASSPLQATPVQP